MHGALLRRRLLCEELYRRSNVSNPMLLAPFRPETDWLLMLRLMRVTLSDRFPENTGKPIYRRIFESSDSSSDSVSSDGPQSWRIPLLSPETAVFAAFTKQNGIRWLIATLLAACICGWLVFSGSRIA
jgi:hypothetical protein